MYNIDQSNENPENGMKGTQWQDIGPDTTADQDKTKKEQTEARERDNLGSTVSSDIDRPTEMRTIAERDLIREWSEKRTDKPGLIAALPVPSSPYIPPQVWPIIGRVLAPIIGVAIGCAVFTLMPYFAAVLNTTVLASAASGGMFSVFHPDLIMAVAHAFKLMAPGAAAYFGLVGFAKTLNWCWNEAKSAFWRQTIGELQLGQAEFNDPAKGVRHMETALYNMFRFIAGSLTGLPPNWVTYKFNEMKLFNDIQDVVNPHLVEDQGVPESEVGSAKIAQSSIRPIDKYQWRAVCDISEGRTYVSRDVGNETTDFMDSPAKFAPQGKKKKTRRADGKEDEFQRGELLPVDPTLAVNISGAWGTFRRFLERFNPMRYRLQAEFDTLLELLNRDNPEKSAFSKLRIAINKWHETLGRREFHNASAEFEGQANQRAKINEFVSTLITQFGTQKVEDLSREDPGLIAVGLKLRFPFQARLLEGLDELVLKTEKELFLNIGKVIAWIGVGAAISHYSGMVTTMQSLLTGAPSLVAPFVSVINSNSWLGMFGNGALWLLNGPVWALKAAAAAAIANPLALGCVAAVFAASALWYLGRRKLTDIWAPRTIKSDLAEGVLGFMGAPLWTAAAGFLLLGASPLAGGIILGLFGLGSIAYFGYKTFAHNYIHRRLPPFRKAIADIDPALVEDYLKYPFMSLQQKIAIRTQQRRAAEGSSDEASSG